MNPPVAAAAVADGDGSKAIGEHGDDADLQMCCCSCG